jgi:hypothetical protein
MTATAIIAAIGGSVQAECAVVVGGGAVISSFAAKDGPAGSTRLAVAETAGGVAGSGNKRGSSSAGVGADRADAPGDGSVGARLGASTDGNALSDLRRDFDPGRGEAAASSFRFELLPASMACSPIGGSPIGNHVCLPIGYRPRAARELGLEPVFGGKILE